MLRLFHPTQPKNLISKVIAVLLYADWCDASRKIVPAFEGLKQRFEEREILFLTLDFTDAMSRSQSYMLASALGISEPLELYMEQTGLIVTLTSRGKRVFGEMSIKEELQAIFELVERKLK
jgi:thiol-disulfide isomerase/thioredoxin